MYVPQTFSYNLLIDFDQTLYITSKCANKINIVNVTGTKTNIKITTSPFLTWCSVIVTNNKYIYINEINWNWIQL